jgi:predicted kinase
MAIVILGIGIPGAGKTTILKPFAARNGFVYINRDDIREELMGDAGDRSDNDAVWGEANRRMAEALASGTSVVLDSTFVEAWKRRDATSFAREHGALSVIGAYAIVSPAEAKARNRARDRNTDEAAIDFLYGKLQEEPPSLADGFDALVPLADIERLGSLLTPGA